MPNYDYRCTACGAELELFQRISEAPLRTCPQCGKDGLERLISPSSFALKGSGWYADGYGAKGGDSKSADKPADKPAEAKPDAKPAPAAPAAEPAKKPGGDSSAKKDAA